MSDKADLFPGFMDSVREEMVSRGLAQPAAGAPQARKAEKGFLQYDNRPELTNTTIQNGPMPERGLPMDRPPTPRGAEPVLDTSKERPELEGPSFIDTLRERNSRTLSELRRDYLAEWEQYRAGRRASRPTWAPQTAIDFSECLKREGPSAGDPPPIDLVTPRA